MGRFAGINILLTNWTNKSRKLEKEQLNEAVQAYISQKENPKSSSLEICSVVHFYGLIVANIAAAAFSCHQPIITVEISNIKMQVRVEYPVISLFLIRYNYKTC